MNSHEAPGPSPAAEAAEETQTHRQVQPSAATLTPGWRSALRSGLIGIVCLLVITGCSSSAERGYPELEQRAREVLSELPSAGAQAPDLGRGTIGKSDRGTRFVAATRLQDAPASLEQFAEETKTKLADAGVQDLKVSEIPATGSEPASVVVQGTEDGYDITVEASMRAGQLQIKLLVT